MLESPRFQEVFRSLTFKLYVVKVENRPSESIMPVIFFEGTVEENQHPGISKMMGTVTLMDDGQVRWSFVSDVIHLLGSYVLTFLEQTSGHTDSMMWR
jgi:hypothetical protein